MAAVKKMNGIDISKWQKGLDLSKVACDFVIVKASEGIGSVDPCFEGFIQQAKKLGKNFGFYHFARPTAGKDPKLEAQFFYKTCQQYFGEGIPFLDWEAENKQNVEWAKAFLNEIYRLSGVKPMIYMSQSVVNQYDWSSVANADYGLWCAKYRDNVIDKNYDMSNAGKKPTVKWWKVLAMWQWTSSGRLDGYASNLDCDLFYGDAAIWKKYAGRTGTPIEDAEPEKPSEPEQPSVNINNYTNDQLAELVLKGVFGNGEARKKALGNRYSAVQKIVEQKVKEQNQKVYHKVVKGDTLTAIAEKYGTTIDAICKLNGIKNANMIIIGQNLRVK